MKKLKNIFSVLIIILGIIVQPTVSVVQAADVSDDDSVNVTYDANGGENVGGIPMTDVVTKGRTYSIRSVGSASDQINIQPASNNQVFAGWNTQRDGQGTSYEPGNTITNIQANVTLYAQWKSKVSMTFDLNGAKGNATPSPISELPGTEITIPAIPDNLTANKERYKVGPLWNLKADGSGDTLSPGSKYTLNEDTKLYAMILPEDPESNALLSFDLNSGTSEDNVFTTGIKADDDYKVTLPDSTPTREDYKFAGWKIDGVVVQPGDTVTVNYKTTAIAQWTYDPTTTIKFESEGTVSGLPDSVTKKTAEFSGKYSVPDTFPERSSENGTQYIFNYYQDTKGNKVYPGQTIAIDNNKANNITLKAIWTEKKDNQIIVTFNGNANSSGYAPATLSVDSGSSINLPGQESLKKDGFVFLGWTIKDDTSETIYETGTKFTPQKDVTEFIANWLNVKEDGYVKYDLQAKSGSNPEASGIVLAESQINLPNVTSDAEPKNEDDNFWGWSTNKNATTPDYYAGEEYTVPAGITTLYGVWGQHTDKNWTQVNLDSNGGTTDDGTTGYPFSYENKEYKKSNYYKLDDSDATYDFVVPDNGNFKKDGYTFDGWNEVDKNGKVIDDNNYKAGETISLEDRKTTRLSINWKEIKHTVTYEMGAATGGSLPNPSSIEVAEAGDGYAVAKNNESDPLTLNNHVFVGWTKKGDEANFGIYAPGQRFKVTEDTTLIPVFIDVTPADGGGTGAADRRAIIYSSVDSDPTITGKLPDNAIVNYGDWYTLANGSLANNATFSREGYTFAGWYTYDHEGKIVNYSEESSFLVTNNMVFYPLWDKNELHENQYSISFNGNKNTSGLAPSTSYVANDGNATFKLPTNDPDNTRSKTNGTLKREKVADINDTDAKIVDNYDYLFMGWSTNPNADPTNPDDFIKPGEVVTVKENTVFYAVWDRKDRDVTVKYDGQGYTGGELPNNQVVPRYTGIKVDPENKSKTLTKDGAIFLGWKGDKDGNIVDYVSGSKISPAADTTLYAQWLELDAPNTNQIRFIYLRNDNSINDLSGVDDINRGDKYSVRNTLSRDGYLFVGWNTKSDGSGTKLTPGEAIDTNTSPNRVLYAQWKKIDPLPTLYVVYDGNGNTSGTAPKEYVGNVNDNVEIANSGSLQKTGYKFVGWSTDPILGNGASYDPGAQYKLIQSIVLYAKWSEFRYETGDYIADPAKITYHDNTSKNKELIVEGAVDPDRPIDNINVFYGHKVPSEEKDGGAYVGEFTTIRNQAYTGFTNEYDKDKEYKFLGWSTNPNATIPDSRYKPDDIITLNTKQLDLYAVWDIPTPPMPTQKGTVITKYVDEKGTPIASDNETTGNYGDPYTTEQKDIKGYKFNKIATGTNNAPAKGYYNNSTQIVTYVYSKIDDPDKPTPDNPDKPTPTPDNNKPSIKPGTNPNNNVNPSNKVKNNKNKNDLPQTNSSNNIIFIIIANMIVLILTVTSLILKKKKN